MDQVQAMEAAVAAGTEEEAQAAKLMIQIFQLLANKPAGVVSTALFSVLASTFYRMGKELDGIVSNAEETEALRVKAKGEAKNGRFEPTIVGTVQDNS